MKIPIFMIFQFVTVIAAWSIKALEDGKITADEGLELVQKLANLIGVPLELKVPDELTKTIDNTTGEPLIDNPASFLSKPDFDAPDK